jgi:hypothetical protein
LGSVRWGYLSANNLTAATYLPWASSRIKYISAYSRNMQLYILKHIFATELSRWKNSTWPLTHFTRNDRLLSVLMHVGNL